MAAVQYGKLHLKTHFQNVTTIESIYTGGKAVISRDEAFLVTPVADDVNVLDLTTGRTVHRLKGEADSMSCIAVKPSGTHLMSASQSLLLVLWDLATGEKVKSWKAHEAPVLAMDFDPTSTLVATGSADSTVKVWDVDGGYCTHNFRGHSGIVSVVKFHPNAKKLKLVSGSDDCKIRVWDLHARSCVAVLESHVSVVRGLDFTADGKFLVSGARDKVVNVWDFETGSLEKTVPIYESVESVGLVPDAAIPVGEGRSKVLAFTGGDKGIVRIWDLEAGTCILAQEPELNSKHVIIDVLYLQKSNTLVAITSDQNILFYDLTSGLKRTRQIAGYNEEVLDLKFMGPEDTHLAVVTNTEQVRIYNMSTMDCDILYGHSEIVMSIDRSIDGSLLASGARDHKVIIWRFLPDEEPSKRYQQIGLGVGHTEPVSTVAFGRKSSRFVLSGSHDRTIKVWDIPDTSVSTELTKLKTRYTFQAHDKDIQSIAVAPNDKLFASGSLDKTAKLWAMEDGRLLGVFKGHKRGIWSVAFSPVDQVLATSSTDKTIKLWSVVDFSCVKTFEGHLNSVLSVSFLSAGMQLVSSGSDGLVKLWTIRSNECVTTLDGHEDRIWALAVQKDEKYVVSGSSDSTIVVWEDMTIQEEEKKQRENEERVLLEQDLSNYLHKRDYKNAILLAMRLDQPFRLLTLFEDLSTNRQDPSSILGSTAVDSIISNLSDSKLAQLLNYIRTWNTNTRHARTAQSLLHVILKAYTPNRLMRVPKCKEIVDALLAYTERHLKIADGLLIQSYVVDYTVECMVGFEERDDLGEGEEEGKVTGEMEDWMDGLLSSGVNGSHAHGMSSGSEPEDEDERSSSEQEDDNDDDDDASPSSEQDSDDGSEEEDEDDDGEGSESDGGMDVDA
ncbi:hypothetical protein SpCBS45565_g01894 [Spizellomyces sp. 'palustris']|nr:hypothetical protein SpCBS45565_g01894 [Spizellomyces sp. 'palustris']